jgi:class 3 adenylate cyclase
MRTVHETISATATFLFTDIEGSTELLKSNRRDYSKLLAEHHRLLRETYTAYGGTEVDNRGRLVLRRLHAGEGRDSRRSGMPACVRQAHVAGRRIGVATGAHAVWVTVRGE